MMLFTPDYLARLGLQAGASERDIKRAYARALKALDQTNQAEEFAQLRQDYENSLQFVGMEIQIVLGDPEQGEPAPEPITHPEPTQPPAPEPAVLAEPVAAPDEDQDEAQEVAAAFAAFESAVQQLSSIIFSEWVTLLAHHLKRPQLIALTARDAFEARLVHALYQRSFGDYNGPVLLSSAVIFGWDKNGKNRLEQWGWEGAQLSHLLDEASLLSSSQLVDWLRLTGAPHRPIVIRLMELQPSWQQNFPQLHAFFYSPAHLEKWRVYVPSKVRADPATGDRHTSTPAAPSGFLSRLSDWIQNHLTGNSRQARNNFRIAVLIVLGVIPSIAALVNAINNHQNSVACDALYATGIRNNWHDFQSDDMYVLKQCANAAPPMMCNDRAGMLELIGVSERLGHSHSTPGLLLRTSAGLAYAIAVDNNANEATKRASACQVARSLLYSEHFNSNWLELGDEAAARNVIEALAQCDGETLATGTNANARTMLKFLQQLDAWPMEKSGSRGARIPLAALIAPPKPIAEKELVRPYRPWPACTTNPMEVLNAPEKSNSAGPGERWEIANRAATR